MNIKTYFDNLQLSFKEIWEYDKRLIFVLMANVLISAISPFPNIIISGKIVDNISNGESFLIVTTCIVIMFALNLAITICNTILNKIREYMFLKLSYKIDNDISEKCLNIDYEKFNDSSIHDRILLVDQVIKGNNFFISLTIVFSIISKVITLIGILCVMATLNVWLILLAIVAIVLQTLLHYVRLRSDRKYRTDYINDSRKASYVSKVTKDIQFKKDIVTFHIKEYIMKKVAFFQQKMLLLDKQHIKVNSYIEIFSNVLTVCFQISVYLIIGINAFIGNISIGDFTVGITSMFNLMTASSYITINILTLNDNYFYIKQYKSFSKIKSKYDKNTDCIKIDDIDLSNINIEFRNVSFRYPNSTDFVLKNVNLKINNKEKLGIVGYNGAGKTTFTLLLTRMYDPTEGVIYLNGIDIKKFAYEDYQHIISTVNQDFSLLAFSLLENIVLKETATMQEKNKILELSRDSGFSGKLGTLYRGLDTPITKELFASGVDLSGGERQKIAFVRSLYKEAPILILDEPTSALDPVAEQEMFDRIIEMTSNKTTVFISHRIYSTRFCDKIVFFEKGRVKEYGTFEQLMKQKGLYYAFFQKQAENFN